MDQALLKALRAQLGADAVATGTAIGARYHADWTGHDRCAPMALVRPRSTAQVATCLRLCHEYAQPVVVQGGLTGLAGGATPRAGELALSLERLKGIESLDVAGATLVAGAGTPLAAIHEAAAAHGLQFALDLAARGSCTIGGNISTNAGGIRVIRYGMAREQVLGLEAVLADGTVVSSMNSMLKNNAGYDLKQLFIGAEGTLGIITAAVLKLFPLPQATATAWLAIESPQTAVRLLSELQRAFGATLTACELVSDVSLSLVLKNIPGSQAPLATSPWYLLVELSGAGEEGALSAELGDFLEKTLESGAISDGVLAQSGEQAKRLWALRENISEAQKIEGFSIKHDISVPISRIAEFVERADAALKEAFPGIRIVTFGHVGDGNLHYNQSKPEAGENAAFIAAQSPVNEIVHDIVHQLGGSISAEHGIGQLKRDELLRYKSPLEMELMRSIKRTLDPQGLMNPGKVL